MATPNEKQKQKMDEINEIANQLKGAINEYFQLPDDQEGERKKNLDFYIEHKSHSRGRRQTEEIEPDINDIQVMEL